VGGNFLIADFVNKDGSTRKVWIMLTKSEKAEYRRAHLKSWLYIFKSPSDLMSPELEEIICGHRDERYITLTFWNK
jgi:hypothetical protein